MKRWHGFALAGIAATVVGCGAGGGSDPTPTRTTPAITVTPTKPATTTAVPSSTPLGLRPRKSSPSPTHKPVARPTAHTPATRPSTHRPTPVATAVYYANCTALRKDHPHGVQKGQPGYRPALDRDHDNTACETSA